MSDEKIKGAMDIIERYGSIDGDHHKQWCLDQIARILLGDKYEEWTDKMMGEYDQENDEYEYPQWDEGIPP